MNLDKEEQDIYNRLNSVQRAEIDELDKSTVFWNRIPKMCALIVVAFVIAAIIL
jgi:hypothetical protein